MNLIHTDRLVVSVRYDFYLNWLFYCRLYEDITWLKEEWKLKWLLFSLEQMKEEMGWQKYKQAHLGPKSDLAYESVFLTILFNAVL